MQLNEITRSTPRKKHQQIGRGGSRGKTSGRGHKGQKARAGHSIRPALRDEMKRIPRLRGRGTNKLTSFQKKPISINLDLLADNFKKGDEVSPATLCERGLVTKPSGSLPEVKILARGDLDIALTIKSCSVSTSARERIEKAGGSIVS